MIFVIDKNKPGYKLGKKILKEGWELVMFSDNVEDANDALKIYGKMWLINYLLTNIKSGFAADLSLELFCKGK